MDSTGQRFSPRMKVRTAEQYTAALRKNRPIRGRLVDLYCYNAGRESPRLGVIVGKRALKRAVDRNYAKRVVRESFRRCASGLRPNDYVVRLRASRDLTRTVLSLIRQDLDALWETFTRQTDSSVRSAPR